MASTLPDQPSTAVATEEPPPKRPRWLRALLKIAYLWWKLVFGTLFLNYLIGGVQQVVQNGRDALGPYLTTWGLFAPWEQANPTLFLAVAGLLIVAAVVGFVVQVEQKVAARRKEAERERKVEQAHATATAAQATATQAQDTASAAHERASSAHSTATTAHETASAAHQAASEAKAHVEDIEQRVQVLEQAGTASALPAGPPQDDALLPAPEPFVGRREDLAWLEERLTTRTSEGRVSAITALGGIGGIGKSALAGQAIKELRMNKRFPDGVAVVLANEQRDARALLRAVLARFEPRINAALPEDATLNDLATAAHQLLDGKDALIVLDNVEPDDASKGWQARLVLDVLSATGVAVLVTARHEVSGVPTGGTRPLDVLPEDDARDLFAGYYAGQGQAWADLSPADQQAAERILTTLGRHTLALTLAARYAATTHRPLAKVAEELANPQRALTLEVPDVPKSVLSTFDLSYVDLPEDAQRLFRALGAVGTNEVGRMATLALAKALHIARPEDTVDLLVARGLLKASTLAGLPDGADSERLTLHPLLREFASHLLADPAEREQAEDALATFYADYAVGHNIVYPLIAADEANITATLDTANARGDRDRVVSDLCWGMAQFWRDRGKYREGLAHLPRGIAAAVVVAKVSQERDDRIQEAQLVSVYGDFLRLTGRLADASAYYEQSLAIRRAVGDRRGEGVVLSNLGQVAQARGQLTEAQAYYEASLAIRREVGDRQGEGADLSNLGQVAQDRGQLADAQSYFEQSLAVLREVGDRRDEGVDLANLGSVAQARGQLDAAQAYYEQSLAIVREVGDRQGEGVVLNNLAALAYQRGQYGDAERYFREALHIARNVGDGINTALTLSNLGLLLVEQNLSAPGEGCAMLAEAARLYDEMGVPDGGDVRETMRQLGCGEQ